MLLELPQPIIGEIKTRVNRFVVEVIVEGKVERAYINNTGRLTELLVKGRRCYCLRKSAGSTSLRLIAIDDDEGAALIDTAIQMRAFERALERGELHWARCSIMARNPRLGGSVLDYLLDCGGELVYAELKSAVLRDGVFAAYPDCPTLRGRRHIIELVRHAEQGGRALIVFVAALQRVTAFRPFERGDPEIPRLLREAAASGVEIRAISMHYDPIRSVILLDNSDLPVVL